MTNRGTEPPDLAGLPRPRPDPTASSTRPWVATGGRFLPDDGTRDPRWNLALDEAIARSAGPHPTLRLWRNGRAVVVGRFQLARAEVELAFAGATATPILRRFTGGGAVYHDPGNLNVSLVLDRDAPPLAEQPDLARLPTLYGLLLEPLARAVEGLGLPVERTERDLLVGGRKVSGVAAWLGRERVLVHGTLLVDADLERLGRLLAGPGDPGNPRWERTKSRRMVVTSLAEALGRVPEAEALDQAIAAAFGFDPRYPSAPTTAEMTLARRLLETRYLDPAWHAD